MIKPIIKLVYLTALSHRRWYGSNNTPRNFSPFPIKEIVVDDSAIWDIGDGQTIGSEDTNEFLDKYLTGK